MKKIRYKLVIAEKPSVAQSLAALIGATARKDGYLEGNGWRVSWCVGHLAGLADADSYDPVSYTHLRIVLEPIVEALFFEHSYGFRSMRDTAMALERLNFLTFHTGYYWFVEGDISKCFDHIDHAIPVSYTHLTAIHP